VYVYIDSYEDTSKNVRDQRIDTDTSTGAYTLIESMQDQIETLKREVEDWKEEARRKDAIIMTMAQRIPELEPAKEPSPEPRESPETPSEDEDKVDTPPEEEQPRASWWRRMFR
jgi:hypothetical protein